MIIARSEQSGLGEAALHCRLGVLHEALSRGRAGGTPYSYALTFLIVTIIIATKYNVLKLMNSIRMLHFLAFYYNIVI